MARNKDQQIRLLALYDLLQNRTDEDHPMSTQEIISALAGNEIVVSRKTLYQDIDLLNKYGYDVICERGRSNRYFVGVRKFERPEIQILLNAIGSTQMLSASKSEILICKLLELLGIGEAAEIRRTVPTSETKHSNERVYYSIDAITTAIIKKHKLLFRYFDYGVNGTRVYRKNGRHYVINPLGMAYSDNQLYLIGYHDQYSDIVHYRIDRMDDVEVMKRPIILKPELAGFDLNEYRKELFDMYSGERMEVELVFPQDLLEIAIDRFGEGIMPICSIDGEYIVKETVQVSKTFFAWLTTFEGRVKIKAPETVREQYTGFIENLLKTFQTN